MKHLKFLLIMFILAPEAEAQTHTVAAGTNAYVTIDGLNYTRGNLRTVYNYRAHDSGLSIVYSNSRIPLFKYTTDTNFLYGDSTSRKARSIVELQTWFNTNFEYKP